MDRICPLCGRPKIVLMLFCFDCTDSFNAANNDLPIIPLHMLLNLPLASFQYRFDQSASALIVHVSCQHQYRGLLVSNELDLLQFCSKQSAIKYLECLGFSMKFTGLIGFRND